LRLLADMLPLGALGPEVLKVKFGIPEVSRASLRFVVRPIDGAVEKVRDEHRKKASALNSVGHI
jgi:hypothetical protein